MKKNQPFRAILTTVIVSTSLFATASAARQTAIAKIDLTKGDKIPAEAPHDWTLGATGMRGWMHCEKFTTTDARQIAITTVEAGSPSAGILAVGDVILGVGGKAFSADPRRELGMAITAAEATDGKLSLLRWRAGQQSTAIITLPVLGSYSATAPYACSKSAKILQLGCASLAKRMQQASYEKINPIPRALNALALLASGDEQYLPLVSREAQWAANFQTDAMATWYYGYTIMLVAEYQMATGDKRYQDGMRRMAMEAAKGQSNVGSWGHKFAQPDGRLSGYGMMNAPGVPLTASLVLARMAGVNDPALDLAIERSATLIRFYIGKGAIPYGDHAPWTQTHEDNGKSGMAAYLFHLLGEPKGADFFSSMALASHGAERDGGHTGNYTNMLWAMPAIALSGPNATGAWMKEFGAWNFDLTRRWDGTFLHQGQPEPKNDSFAKWDVSGTFLLAYAMPQKKIYLTGKKPASIPPRHAKDVESIIAAGRGWTNKDRFSFYDQKTSAELLETLRSWSPTVRERAALSLARRKSAPPVTELIAMLQASDLSSCYGACAALAQLKGAAAPAVDHLSKLLTHDDLWLRIQAAEALGGIGQSAMPTLPKLLERITLPPSKEDPRGMEQRYLCSVVFSQLLNKHPLTNVDAKLLQKAIIASLKNQDGRARSVVGTIYDKLSYEQLKPLLPAIHEAIVKPAPSGEMFASGIRLSGCEILAKHHYAEGMKLSLDVLELDNWGKKDRIPRVIKALQSYEGSAKVILPDLRKVLETLKTHKEAKSLAPMTEKFAELIKQVESSTNTVALRTFQQP